MSSVGADYVLKDGDIPALLEILTSISHKWKELATALELKGYLIAQNNNNSFVLAMGSTIREWVAGNGTDLITLGMLKSKLESNAVGEKVFAKEFIAKFNKERFGVAAPGATPSGTASSASVADGK